MSTINLLPEDYLDRRAQQRANVICLILFSIVMAGVVGAALVSEEQARQVRQVREEVNEQYREAGQMIAQMQELEGKKKKVIEKAEMAASLIERVPRSYLLACLTNALPSEASLTGVKLATEQPRVTRKVVTSKAKFRARAVRADAEAEPEEPKPEPLKVKLEITGLAEDGVQVAQFIERMNRNPLMASVELDFIEEEQVGDEALQRFQVTMDLKLNAEVELDAESDGESSPGETLAKTSLEDAHQ